MFNVTEFIPTLVNVIITIPLSAIFLWFIGKYFRLENGNFKTAFKISLLIFGFGFVIAVAKLYVKNIIWLYFALSIITWILAYSYLALVLIKKNYRLDWQETFIIWLIWMVIWLILGLLITYSISGILLTFTPY